MSKIIRPNKNIVAFASNATGSERTVFGGSLQSDSLDDNLNDDYSRGWGITAASSNPAKQDFNAAFYTSSALLSYVFQKGVPEWNQNQEYYINSIVNVSGVLYVSKVDNNSSNPTSSENWSNLVPSVTVESINALKKTGDTATGKIKFNEGIEDLKTNIGRLGTINGITINSDDDLYNLPQGFHGMVARGSGYLGIPEQSGYIVKISNRDFDRGFSVFFSSYKSPVLYIGTRRSLASPLTWERLLTKGNGLYLGEIRHFAFRKTELPVGWISCDGALYDISSIAGAALNSLSANFKLDWNISVTNGKINTPNLFASDGRGYFIKSSVSPGVVSDEELPNITGSLGASLFDTAAPSGAFYGLQNAGDAGGGSTANQKKSVLFSAARSSSIYKDGGHVAPINRGMTPAIYLGI